MIIDELIAKLGFELEGEGDLKKFNDGLTDVERKAKVAADRINMISVAVGSFVGNIAANLTTKVASMVGSLPGEMTRAAADFESLMTAIEKKSGATADQMKVIGDEILDLAMGGELASSIEDIASAYERGAAAGIPIEELREFANISAMAADAFEMSAEQVGNAAAGFEKGLGVARDQMESFFDLINSLADSGISDEVDIINFLDRAGASLTTIGLTKEEVAALGATLVNLKMPAEVAARAMDTLGGKLIAPQNLGKKAKAAFQEIVGDAGSFAKLMAEDANAGLLLFLEKLEGMDSARRIGVLGAMLGEGFDDEVARLVVGLDEYRRNLALAADEEQWVGSLRESYSKKLDDYWSKSQRFWNNHEGILKTLGERTLPIFGEALDDLSDYMHRIAFDGSLEAIADGFGKTLRSVNDFGRNMWSAARFVYSAADGVVELISRVTGFNKAWSASLFGAALVGSSMTGRAALKWLAARFPAVAGIVLLEEIVAGLSGKKSYIGGLEGGQEALDGLREAANRFRDAINEVQPAWEKLLNTDPTTFMNQSLLQFVTDMTQFLRELATVARAIQQGDWALAAGIITRGIEGPDSLQGIESYQDRRGRTTKAKDAQGEGGGTFGRFVDGLNRGRDKAPLETVIPSPLDPAAVLAALQRAGDAIAESWRAAMENMASGKGDRLSFVGPQPDASRFDSTPAQPANAEALMQALENFRGNMQKVAPEAAAQSVLNDNSVANDNRDMSNHVTVGDINVTVQEATEAPAAVGSLIREEIKRSVPEYNRSPSAGGTASPTKNLARHSRSSAF